MTNPKAAESHRPTLVVIAGPNGAGKTTLTEKALAHEWLEGCEYINPDLIAEHDFGGWNDPHSVLKAARGAERRRAACLASELSIAHLGILPPKVDREYVYDNSLEDRTHAPVFSTVDGEIKKAYGHPCQWAEDLVASVWVEHDQSGELTKKCESSAANAPRSITKEKVDSTDLRHGLAACATLPHGRGQCRRLCGGDFTQLAQR